MLPSMQLHSPQLDIPEAAASRLMLAVLLHDRGLMTMDEAAAYAGVSVETLVNAFAGAQQVSSQWDASRRQAQVPTDFKLSVLMPAYNEAPWLLTVLNQVAAVRIRKEILVVNDGSTDGTRQILDSDSVRTLSDVRVLHHPVNLGKGSAIRTAIAHATGTVCLIQDADLESDPNEYHQLLAPILDGRADAVYGSRFFGGRPHRVDSLSHYLGNRLLTSLANLLTNLHLTDMETCYKVVRTPLLKSLRLTAKRFEIEPEITIRLAAARAKIYEIPISYNPRDYSEGKKIGWHDGVKAIVAMLRYRFWDLQRPERGVQQQ